MTLFLTSHSSLRIGTPGHPCCFPFLLEADCDAESSRQRSLIEMSQRLSDVTNAIAQKQVYIQTQRDRNAKYSLNTHPRVNTVRRPAVHFETELKRINDSADIKEALQEVRC